MENTRILGGTEKAVRALFGGVRRTCRDNYNHTMPITSEMRIDVLEKYILAQEIKINTLEKAMEDMVARFALLEAVAVKEELEFQEEVEAVAVKEEYEFQEEVAAFAKEGVSLKPNLIVTPINKNPNSKAALDYSEQKEREKRNEQLMWDDTPTNKGKKGDYFGFVFNDEKVVFHKITGIYPVEDRLPSWSSNVGQTTRQVLYLSGIIRTMEWAEWIQLGGSLKIQGSINIKKDKDKIIGGI